MTNTSDTLGSLTQRLKTLLEDSTNSVDRVHVDLHLTTNDIMIRTIALFIDQTAQLQLVQQQVIDLQNRCNNISKENRQLKSQINTLLRGQRQRDESMY